MQGGVDVFRCTTPKEVEQATSRIFGHFSSVAVCPYKKTSL